MSYCRHCTNVCRNPDDCHAEENAGPPEDQYATELRTEFYRRELQNDLWDRPSRFSYADS